MDVPLPYDEARDGPWRKPEEVDNNESFWSRRNQELLAEDYEDLYRRSYKRNRFLPRDGSMFETQATENRSKNMRMEKRTEKKWDAQAGAIIRADNADFNEFKNTWNRSFHEVSPWSVNYPWARSKEVKVLQEEGYYP